MSVPNEILALAELTGVERLQISHYFAGRADAGDVTIEVPRGRCVIIAAVEQTDIDSTAAHTIAIESAGVAQGAARTMELFAGTLPAMYFLPSGRHVITLVLTAAAGKTAHTLFSYFELPDDAAGALKACATRNN